MNIGIRFSRIVGFSLMDVWMVTACSPESDIDSDPDGTVALDHGAAAASMAASACEQLLDFQLAGVTVNEAVALQVSERQTVPQTMPLEGLHCKVTGVIDSTINFELLMPDDWNGKFLMGGGGGFCFPNCASRRVMYRVEATMIAEPVHIQTSGISKKKTYPASAAKRSRV
ncbi:MAG: hypothetical protein IIC12_03970 [Proteobacteria bacterium]|nr:hypothetical protein [Pseudomonadota bacterium]